MRKLYIIGMIILLLILLFTELSTVKAVDWTRNYSARRTAPYGTFLLKEILQNRFQEKLIPWSRTIFEFDSVPDRSTYLFVNSGMSMNSLDMERLFAYVERGNTAFLMIDNPAKNLLDSLGLKKKVSFEIADKLEFGLLNRQLGTERFYYNEENPIYSYYYFTQIDTANTEVLGDVEADKMNFIRIRRGKGLIYLHLLPMTVSNLTLIDQSNYHYSEKVLSYIESEFLIFDEYYKGQPQQYGFMENQHIFRYLLKEESLRWALRIAVIISLLFLILNSRRRQHIIPLIAAPVNRSLEYAKTIGQLHFEQRDHKAIAKRLIRFLFEEIRKSYGMQTELITSDYYQSLANKSGCDIAVIRKLFILIKDINLKKSISTEELQLLNSALEDFYTQRI